MAAHVVDGEFRATRVFREPGNPLEIRRDAETTVTLLRVPRAEVVDIKGRPLTDSAFEALEPCLRDDCPPCTLPAAGAGLIALNGQGCPLSGATVAGYDAEGTCIGSLDGVHCPANPETGDTFRSLRRQIGVRLPGDAELGPEPPNRSLERLAVTALAPGTPASPIHAWTARDDAVFGVGEDILTIITPDGQRNLSFDALGARPHAAVARSDHILVAARRPRLFSDRRDDWFLFPISASGDVQPPRALNWESTNLSFGLLDRGDLVWSHGQQTVFGGFAAALSVCRVPLGCEPVGLVCDEAAANLRGLVETTEGRGVAWSERALHAGELARAAAPWPCVTPQGRDEEGRLFTIEELSAYVKRADAYYLCARIEQDPCAPNQDYVLTSTNPVSPIWSVRWKPPVGAECRDLLPLPDRNDGIRVRVEAELVDLPPGEDPMPAGNLADVFGTEGAYFTTVLPGPTVLSRGRAGRTHLVGEGSAPQIWGPEAPFPADWTSAVARPGGGFLVASERGELVAVSPDGAVGPPRVPLGLDDASGAMLAANPQELLIITADGRYQRLDLDGDPKGPPAEFPAPFGLPTLVAGMGAAGFVVLDDRTGAMRIPEDGPPQPLAISMDDPATPEEERWNLPDPDACSGRIDRNDWRAVAGGEGGAWAVGQRGLIVRFTARGGVRRVLPVQPNLESVRVDRMDRVMVAGRGRPSGAMGRIFSTLQVWQFDLEEGFDAIPTEPHRVTIESSGFPEVLVAQARALLGSEPLRGRPLPIVLDNGFVVRLGGDDRFVYRRVPFVPRGAVEDRSTNQVLFYGEEGRLALGRP